MKGNNGKGDARKDCIPEHTLHDRDPLHLLTAPPPQHNDKTCWTHLLLAKAGGDALKVLSRVRQKVPADPLIPSVPPPPPSPLPPLVSHLKPRDEE